MTVQIIFYIFAILSVLGALSVISASNPVRAVVSLIFTFFAAAGVWVTMQAFYLALLLIIVYVGAVMVMFLFVVMMLDVEVAKRNARFVRYWPMSILVGVLLFVMLLWLVRAPVFSSGANATLVYAGLNYNDLMDLGHAMFGDYLYPFELSAIILLSAMIAAIMLTYRGRRKGNKAIAVSEQLKVKPKDRLRLVNLKSETKTPPSGETPL
jgi:NADH-quinone oxidoreductase subunit J